MKKIMMLALLSVLCAPAIAQEKNEKEEGKEKEKKVSAPAAVANAFKKEFPNISRVSWSDEDGDFEAEFKLDGGEASATYDKSGHRKELETEIKREQLPAGVLDYIKNNFADHKITETAKIVDDQNVVTYEAEVTKSGKSRDLLFDVNGKLKEEKKD